MFLNPTGLFLLPFPNLLGRRPAQKLASDLQRPVAEPLPLRGLRGKFLTEQERVVVHQFFVSVELCSKTSTQIYTETLSKKKGGSFTLCAPLFSTHLNQPGSARGVTPLMMSQRALAPPLSCQWNRLVLMSFQTSMSSVNRGLTVLCYYGCCAIINCSPGI